MYQLCLVGGNIGKGDVLINVILSSTMLFTLTKVNHGSNFS